LYKNLYKRMGADTGKQHGEQLSLLSLPTDHEGRGLWALPLKKGYIGVGISLYENGIWTTENEISASNIYNKYLF
jgi:hypothetical protein